MNSGDDLNPIAVTIVGFLLAALVATLAVQSAWSHESWISNGGHRNAAGEWCCGSGDCFMLDKRDVTMDRDGYLITRRLASTGETYGPPEHVPFAEAQPSPDGEFWRCKRPDGSRRCFFAPPPST